MRDLTVPTPTPLPSRAEIAAMGFLAQYRGETLKLYRVHLKVYFAWCTDHGLDPLEVSRTHLDLFRHYLEVDRGNAVGTVASRLTCLRTFYAFAVEEEYLERSPAARLHIPKPQRDESRLTGLSRHELATLLAYAQGRDATRWALVALMALLGLRVSEACSIRIEDTRDAERGYRVLRLRNGKGGKPATMPITVPIARAIDAAAGDRTEGFLLVRQDGNQLDRRTAYRWIRLMSQRAIGRPIHPHALRHTMITLSLDAGVPIRDVQTAARHSDARMTSRYDRNRNALDRHASHVLSAYVAGAA